MSRLAIGLGYRTGAGHPARWVSSDGLILTVHYMLLGAQSVIVPAGQWRSAFPAKIIAKGLSDRARAAENRGARTISALKVVSAEKVRTRPGSVQRSRGFRR